MDNNINQNKIKAIADHYGIENQLKKSREEAEKVKEEAPFDGDEFKLVAVENL